MDNYMDYKIAFVVLFSILGIVIILPFACFYFIIKMRNNNCCYRGIIPENNLPV